MKLLKLTAAAFSLLALTSGAAFAQAPANDDCSGAINISSSFGQAIGTVTNTGPYDNTNATVNASDPTTGFECFGEPDGTGTAPALHNTLWFSFVGDGNLYFIETGQCDPASTNYIDDGDTQIAIYSGTCGSLTPVMCNEDGPSATATSYPAGLSFRPEVGVTYYLMVDGFSFNGAISKGEFCLLISRMPDVTCSDASVTAGTVTATETAVCPGDAVTFTATGVTSPNVGDYFGVSWVVTLDDLQGNYANITSSNLVASYNLSSPAPANSTRTFTNDGTLIDGTTVPYGTYYWTPVVYGMATLDPASTTATYLSDLVLDANCTKLGSSVAVAVNSDTAAACLPIGIEEIANNTIFSIISVYPMPVQNELNVNFNAAQNASVNVIVRDVLGREVAVKNMVATAGTNNVNISMANNTAGVYFVTVTDGNSVAVSKFVKN